jgi:hypothetical protein
MVVLLRFIATVTHYDSEKDMHLIEYENDGAIERLSLNDVRSKGLLVS